VFGTTQRSRLRFVLGAWAHMCDNGNACGADVIRNALGAFSASGAKADMVAVAAYFDCGLGQDPAQDMQVGSAPSCVCCLSQQSEQMHRNCRVARIIRLTSESAVPRPYAKVLLAAAQLTKDQMLARCNASLPGLRSHLARAKEVAAGFGLPLTTYEAGPHIVESTALTGSATPGAADRWGAVSGCTSPAEGPSCLKLA
jgi:hypothetical protein